MRPVCVCGSSGGQLRANLELGYTKVLSRDPGSSFEHSKNADKSYNLTDYSTNSAWNSIKAWCPDPLISRDSGGSGICCASGNKLAALWYNEIPPCIESGRGRKKNGRFAARGIKILRDIFFIGAISSTRAAWLIGHRFTRLVFN